MILVVSSMLDHQVVLLVFLYRTKNQVSAQIESYFLA